MGGSSGSSPTAWFEECKGWVPVRSRSIPRIVVSPASASSGIVMLLSVISTLNTSPNGYPGAGGRATNAPTSVACASLARRRYSIFAQSRRTTPCPPGSRGRP